MLSITVTSKIGTISGNLYHFLVLSWFIKIHLAENRIVFIILTTLRIRSFQHFLYVTIISFLHKSLCLVKLLTSNGSVASICWIVSSNFRLSSCRTQNLENAELLWSYWELKLHISRFMLRSRENSQIPPGD